jgi:outer membrane scaffolding protein for murein synthesis (MipA/OmpV family)
LWELGLGGAALRLPHYRGSDQTHDWLLPLPYAVYRGDLLRADREGARAVLLDGDRVDVDLSLGASAPSRSRDDRARSGMADLDPTLEFGPNLKVSLGRGAGWKLELRLPARAVYTLRSQPRHIGWTSQPVLNLDLDLDGWKLGLQGGPLAATRRYHGYFYGVGSTFATPARPAYTAPGGAAGWQATAALSRQVGATWWGAFLRADTLAGAAFDASPLVRQREQLSFGVAASWIFKVSDERVAGAR